MATGLLASLASGIAPVFLSHSGQAFDFGFALLTLPVIGDVGISTSVIFDAGVFLTVVGVVAAAVDSLGIRETG